MESQLLLLDINLLPDFKAKGRAGALMKPFKDLDSKDSGLLSLTQFSVAVRKIGLQLSRAEISAIAEKYQCKIQVRVSLS